MIDAIETPRAAAISVVTVTYNNLRGLVRTLESLSRLTVEPLEVLVIDGASTDGTSETLAEFSLRMPRLRFISEPDSGIYHAMNKGRALAKGALIHYLNAGDIVLGEPYSGIEGPSRLMVEICEAGDRVSWQDFIKLRGFGYCHQGLIFPAEHPAYDTQYKISGDLDVIMRTFPQGIYGLPVASHGAVRYFLGGVSSSRSALLDRELIKIAAKNRGVVTAISMGSIALGRRLLPRFLRRLYARSFHLP
jgi:glycosyltransferase involved in cell wall biosynthesis